MATAKKTATPKPLTAAKKATTAKKTTAELKAASAEQAEVAPTPIAAAPVKKTGAKISKPKQTSAPVVEVAPAKKTATPTKKATAAKKATTPAAAPTPATKKKNFYRTKSRSGGHYGIKKGTRKKSCGTQETPSRQGACCARTISPDQAQPSGRLAISNIQQAVKTSRAFLPAHQESPPKKPCASPSIFDRLAAPAQADLAVCNSYSTTNPAGRL